MSSRPASALRARRTTNITDPFGEGPLVKDILLGTHRRRDQKIRRLLQERLGGRLGETEGLFFAGTLAFTPTENLHVRLRYSDRSDEDGPEATPLIARYTEHNCGPFPGFTSRPLGGLPPGFTTVGQARRSYCGPLQAPSGAVGINVALPANINAGVPLTESKLELDHSLLSGSAEYMFAGGHSITAVLSTQDYELRVSRTSSVHQKTATGRLSASRRNRTATSCASHRQPTPPSAT